jgi:hypothetical protein
METLNIRNHSTVALCCSGFYSDGFPFNPESGTTCLCFLLFVPLALHKRASGFISLYCTSVCVCAGVCVCVCLCVCARQCVCVCFHSISRIRWQFCNILFTYTPFHQTYIQQDTHSRITNTFIIWPLLEVAVLLTVSRNGKSKGKIRPITATKAQRGSRGIALLSL